MHTIQSNLWIGRLMRMTGEPRGGLLGGGRSSGTRYSIVLGQQHNPTEETLVVFGKKSAAETRCISWCRVLRPARCERCPPSQRYSIWARCCAAVGRSIDILAQACGGHAISSPGSASFRDSSQAATARFLMGISKRGSQQLRSLLVHGARSVVRTARRPLQSMDQLVSTAAWLQPCYGGRQ